jgi:hypothetical protein
MNMNCRTKVLWLPSLCALILSNVLLALFQVLGPAPHFYWFHLGKDLEAFCAFVIPWLITQPLVGAMAAYWSRRVGGAVRHQLLAALAPAIGVLVLFLVILPWALIVERPSAPGLRLRAFLALTLAWVVMPAIPLLIGATPFLRRHPRQA